MKRSLYIFKNTATNYFKLSFQELRTIEQNIYLALKSKPICVYTKKKGRVEEYEEEGDT